MATTDTPSETDANPAPADFGANEWLVEDMYERYLADPSSVDAAWHDFFDDFRPRPDAPAPANGRDAPVTPETAAKSGASTDGRSRRAAEGRREARHGARLEAAHAGEGRGRAAAEGREARPKPTAPRRRTEPGGDAGEEAGRRPGRVVLARCAAPRRGSWRTCRPR